MNSVLCAIHREKSFLPVCSSLRRFVHVGKQSEKDNIYFICDLINWCRKIENGVGCKQSPQKIRNTKNCEFIWHATKSSKL